MIDLTKALQLKTQRKNDTERAVVILDGGISHSSTPMSDIIYNFTAEKHDAIADAIEQFTADELADFLIDVAETLRDYEPESKFDFDDLESMASDLRYLANDLSDTAKRYKKAAGAK